MLLWTYTGTEKLGVRSDMNIYVPSIKWSCSGRVSSVYHLFVLVIPKDRAALFCSTPHIYVLKSLEQGQANIVSVFTVINWPRWFNINFLEPRSLGLVVRLGVMPSFTVIAWVCETPIRLLPKRQKCKNKNESCSKLATRGNVSRSIISIVKLRVNMKRKVKTSPWDRVCNGLIQTTTTTTTTLPPDNFFWAENC